MKQIFQSHDEINSFSEILHWKDGYCNMKNIKSRVIAMILCLSICITGLVVPVSATFNDGFRDMDSVSDWESAISGSPAGLINMAAGALGIAANTSDVFWYFVDSFLNSRSDEVSIAALNQICAQCNEVFHANVGVGFFSELFAHTSVDLLKLPLTSVFGLNGINFEVQQHPSSGFWRIRDTYTGIWIVTSSGRYPYTEGSSVAATSGGDQWIGEYTAGDNINVGSVHMMSLSSMQNICNQLKASGIAVTLGTMSNGKYRVIKFNRKVWADSSGYPYVCYANESGAAVNGDRNDTSVTEKDPDGEITNVTDNSDNSTNIDMSGMTITLPDGTLQLIDSIIYDESTKTYNIDSHDVYNTYNYYTWNYYINYTSITYIGTSEEYNKYYEVYYELPDGRDSADLTAEELEQLNLSIDVINYGRSADDVSLRSLYHFDGDTRDSSYWNYCTDFTWNTGASLTYMESGNFDGALYLDETDHDFTLKLPSNMLTSDFTFQFRYYQSYTAAPQTDSYIQFGDAMVLQLDGANLKTSGGSSLCGIPIGSWNEIALVRNSGTLYFYLNGVSVGSVSDSASYANTIRFHFGSSQQTYKQLDELRFVNQALYTGGSNYTCTSVPYDTNLTLVLPDSSVPVADEYWKITSSGTNLLSYDLMSGSSPGFKVRNASYNSPTACYFPNMGYCSTYTSVESFDGFTRISALQSGRDSNGYRAGLYGTIYYSGTYHLPNGSYVFSVVLADGTVCSLPFSGFSATAVNFDWGSLKVFRDSSYGSYALAIEPTSSVDIMYMELVEGSSTDLAAEKITSVTILDADSLNTPTLAVRSDIDVTSFQIGGARPSLPTKGLVWALVENQYITSLQIYDGSAWQGVDGRIWTGSRWIPYNSFNVITLKDMYDIVDASGGNYEYIYTEAGFWAWWQKAWNAFTEKLFSVLGSGSSGSSSAVEDTSDPVEDVTVSGASDSSKQSTFFLVKIFYKLFFKDAVDQVTDSAGDFAGVFDPGGSSGSSSSGQAAGVFPALDGESIWDY